LSGHGFGQKRVSTEKDKGEVTMQIGKEMAIPSILKIGNGALGKIGGYLKAENLDQVVLFFGNGLIDMFGELVMNSLKEAEVNVLEYNELDTVDIDDIITLAFAIPNKAKAVISIGGGKVIDAGKYAAFLRNLPFISVPTSSSSDGFSSASASLLVQGKRTSVPARLAYGIIVDTQVIRTAPEKFIYSGIGDMISKITALYDWIFEEKAGCGEVNDFAVMIAKKAVNSFVRTPYESIKDELFLKELLDSLAMSGIANEIAGSSAPTSGSEHLISHALDKILEVPQLHGIQVGIATYIMAKVQDHRYIRVSTVLQDTGFWDYVATLHMKRSDFLKAIDMAPSIKPHRHTYLHEEKYREAAKKLVLEDEVLNRVLED
jgi:glycerol-1-phosphate dehydrogenase [NAD(P)+]